MKPKLARHWPLVLALVAASLGCAACASRSTGGTSQGAGGGAAAGNLDSGFLGATSPGGTEVVSTTPAAPTDSLSYINGSEVAGPSGQNDQCTPESGFKESLAPDATGYSTPLAAVDAFDASGDQPDFRTTTGTWTIVTDRNGKTFSRDGVTLDVWTLPDGTWLVTGGTSCS